MVGGTPSVTWQIRQAARELIERLRRPVSVLEVKEFILTEKPSLAPKVLAKSADYVRVTIGSSPGYGFAKFRSPLDHPFREGENPNKVFWGIPNQTYDGGWILSDAHRQTSPVEIRSVTVTVESTADAMLSPMPAVALVTPVDETASAPTNTSITPQGTTVGRGATGPSSSLDPRPTAEMGWCSETCWAWDCWGEPTFGFGGDLLGFGFW
jgi:hypothetical protein